MHNNGKYCHDIWCIKCTSLHSKEICFTRKTTHECSNKSCQYFSIENDTILNYGKENSKDVNCLHKPLKKLSDNLLNMFYEKYQ